MAKFPYLNQEAIMGLSKTQQGLRLVAEGMSYAEAARKVGVSRQSLHATATRRAQSVICPCCGQAVSEGFELDTSVLKKSAMPTDAD